MRIFITLNPQEEAGCCKRHRYSRAPCKQLVVVESAPPEEFSIFNQNQSFLTPFWCLTDLTILKSLLNMLSLICVLPLTFLSDTNLSEELYLSGSSEEGLAANLPDLLGLPSVNSVLSGSPVTLPLALAFSRASCSSIVVLLDSFLI